MCARPCRRAAVAAGGTVPKLMLGMLLAASAIAQTTRPATPSTQPESDNPVGWEWLLAPVEIRPNAPALHWRGVAGDAEYSFRRVADGVVVLNLQTTDRCVKAGQGNEYRVVVIAGGQRRNVGWKSHMGSAQGINYHFRPAHAMPPSGPAWVGIERLTPDGRRRQSEDAVQRAAAAGVEVLGLPEPGRVLPFRLRTLDGNVISSDELRGKVVLIDGWASSCERCMAQMPQLRKLRRQYETQGLEIIGINFDETAAKAGQAVAEHELGWPQVYVPPDERTRELWYQASSLSSLPRLILVDGEGVVRADVKPEELEDELERILTAMP